MNVQIESPSIPSLPPEIWSMILRHNARRTLREIRQQYRPYLRDVEIYHKTFQLAFPFSSNYRMRQIENLESGLINFRRRFGGNVYGHLDWF